MPGERGSGLAVVGALEVVREGAVREGRLCVASVAQVVPGASWAAWKAAAARLLHGSRVR